MLTNHSFMECYVPVICTAEFQAARRGREGGGEEEEGHGKPHREDQEVGLEG